MEIMNEEKMYPRGRAIAGNVGEASCKEGTQTNTKRYIDPSKQVCVKPIANKMGSASGHRAHQRVSLYTRLDNLKTVFTVAHDFPCLTQSPQLERVDARDRRTTSASIVLCPSGFYHEIRKDE